MALLDWSCFFGVCVAQGILFVHVIVSMPRSRAHLMAWQLASCQPGVLVCGALLGRAACMPVACMPVACMPVACMPVACMPAACMPVACTPVACLPVACMPVARACQCLFACMHARFHVRFRALPRRCTTAHVHPESAEPLPLYSLWRLHRVGKRRPTGFA